MSGAHFGIAAGGLLQSESTAVLDRDLDAVKASGAALLRVDVNWAQIQAGGESKYDWAMTDAVINGARQRSLGLLAVLTYTPTWARPANAPATAAPAPDRFATFVTAAVKRYGASVKDWEVWNEPNTSSSWYPEANGAQYAGVLAAAATAIRAAQPEAKVLTGGLAPATTGNGEIAPVPFLQSLYAAGARPHFDAVGMHPYCWPAEPGADVSWSAWWQMTGAKDSLRSVMATHGDEGKQIWATEFGAPTGGPKGSFVTQAQQAAMITQAYKLWLGYSWAGPMFVFQLRDEGTAESTTANWFGLLDNNFTAKPAYHSYQQAATQH
jgi:polysaccharide biosynthesis protein PslG